MVSEGRRTVAGPGRKVSVKLQLRRAHTGQRANESIDTDPAARTIPA